MKSSTKNIVSELPYELSIDLKLRIFGNSEIMEKNFKMHGGKA